MTEEIIIAFVVGLVTNLFTNWLWDRFKEWGWIKESEAAPVVGASMSARARRKAMTWWGLLPLLYLIAAFLLIEHRWPLTEEKVIWLLVGGFIVNLGLLAIGMIISVRLLERGGDLVLMLIVLAAEFCALYLLDRSLPNHIALDCPTGVESVTAIQGQVIDPDCRIYLLVKPHSVGNLYVMEPTYPGKDGVWFARGDFSGAVGATYEISAVALRPEQVPKESPSPEWLIRNAPWKTSICVVTRVR